MTKFAVQKEPQDPDLPERTEPKVPAIGLDKVTTYNPRKTDKASRAWSQNNVSAILDAGSILTYLDDELVDDIYDMYSDDRPSIYWPEDEFRYIDCDFTGSSRYVEFTFGSLTIRVPSSELILRIKVFGYEEACVFGLAPQSKLDGRVVLGYTFLRSTYAVFHLGRDEVYLGQYNPNWRQSSRYEHHQLQVNNGIRGVRGVNITDTFVPYSYPDEAEPGTPDVSSTPSSTGPSDTNSAVAGSPTSERESSSATSPQATDPSSPEEDDTPLAGGANMFASTWLDLMLWGLCGVVAILVRL